MKKMRKGFTLVELLIVVAILAILTTAMMVSMRGATAKAKASSIAANLDACRTAALLYYVENGDQKIDNVAADTMLAENLKTWNSLKGGTDDAISYTAVGTTPATWAVNVDFSNDAEKVEIARALKKMRGYNNFTALPGVNIFDFLGVTPAFAATEGEEEEVADDSKKDGDDSTETNGKLYMILITGEIGDGKSDGTQTTTAKAKTE